MSSGSAGLAVFSAFTSLFSIAGVAVGAVGVTVTFGLGGVDFAVTAFFTVFFFLEVFGWLRQLDKYLLKYMRYEDDLHPNPP